MFAPDLQHQTLAIIGCLDSLGPNAPLREMQCRVAARVFKVCSTTPPDISLGAQLTLGEGKIHFCPKILFEQEQQGVAIVDRKTAVIHFWSPGGVRRRPQRFASAAAATTAPQLRRQLLPLLPPPPPPVMLRLRLVLLYSHFGD